MKLTLYSKPYCPLCDEALEQIELARQAAPFDLEEINILTDPGLYDRHRHDIPVLAMDGAILFRHRIDAALLVRLIQNTNQG